MEIKILKVSTDELVGATIFDGKKVKLPSIQDGWRFNFDKLSKTLSNAETYVLISEESLESVEGCLIFQMVDKKIPYMAYLEVAPHNQARPKRYDYIAGCLIAFAFKLSVQKGKGDYQAQLFFDVQEEKEENAKKLFELYRTKYGALFFRETTLVIIDDAGYNLISKYLERKFKD
jgi:hypothetical protein